MGYLCIHGHFYQPPRENPWLEAIELQDSAYPYHDWNERITAECYATNAAARILDNAGRILKILSNYPKMSFDFGPTLLSWLELRAPKVYKAILHADKVSQRNFSGHGSAIAQAYNHMIMPLANRRDKITQVAWGIRDFKHRFGRFPEGMWLPETAVDIETLEILAERDIKFTILAPRQARRESKIGGRVWKDVSGEQIDPSMAYSCRLPSGRSINLFFYDGPISRAIAFENLLASGEQFVDRLMCGFAEEVRSWPELVHVAIDGETFGHHHKMGEMTLAFALDRLETADLARVTNYAEYLGLHPPIHRVEIFENTSWSCIHGIERWRGNCGCNSGGRPGWTQEWRGPLRDALDWLRDTLAPQFEELARPLLKDPWAARDEYISVVLDRSPQNVDRFFREQSARELDATERVTALKLLELQRNAMLMYTSCGWFFDELSGIETVQCIQYAGRVVDLARQLFRKDVEPAFLERLSLAKSNLPEYGDGARIYDKCVRPSVIDLPKVAAHYAIASVFEPSKELNRIYCYDVEREDYTVHEKGSKKLAIGRLRVSSAITSEFALLSVAALHLGNQQVKVGVREGSKNNEEEQAYLASVKELAESFRDTSAPEMAMRFDVVFGKGTHSLRSLFKDEQRKILELVLAPLTEESEAAHIQLYERSADLMRFLTDLHIPIPKPSRASAEFALNHHLRREFLSEEPSLERVAPLIEEARAANIDLDVATLEYALRRRLEQMAETLSDLRSDPGPLSRFQAAVELARALPFPVNLWQVQNVFYEQLRSLTRSRRMSAEQPPDASRWAAELARVGETLLFTPEALNLVFHSTAAD
jgi:alpha-amylase/alpha-mannosidase (GH57 family)